MAQHVKPVLVWFKRDLRVDDHEALTHALLEGPVLPVYVVEPGYWANDYTSGRQWQFARESIAALDAELTALGQPLWTAVGDVVEVFERLHSRFAFQAMHSHQETGPDWTFQRDRAVKAWCESRHIQWVEHKQHGVIRGLTNRARWASQWGSVMDAPCQPRPVTLPLVAEPPKPAMEVVAHVSIADERLVGSQPGGSLEAHALLESFLETRGERYRGGMSSPNTAETVCSRLSPHFAWGTLSVRTAWQESQRIRARFKSEKSAEAKRWSASLKSFGSRLHWHCHFIQKLETEPRIEFEEVHRGFIGFRPIEETRLDWMERFEQGQLGWPFVDACLRCLAQTGWLNFRMRAMLVAVASYHLWIDWRQTANVLGRWFTDFEAGIHFSQIQMQSGVTGINANRVYAPIKQSMDQDPEGRFIKRWVPELESVPVAWVHTPWRMPVSMQHQCGCIIGRDYPEPVGDPVQMAREARARLTDWITTHDLSVEAARVLKQHGSRLRQARPRYGKKTHSPQLPLDI